MDVLSGDQKSRNSFVINGGRYWTRTNDFLLVSERKTENARHPRSRCPGDLSLPARVQARRVCYPEAKTPAFLTGPKSCNSLKRNGEPRWTRTSDPLLKRQML